MVTSVLNGTTKSEPSMSRTSKSTKESTRQREATYATVRKAEYGRRRALRTARARSGSRLSGISGSFITGPVHRAKPGRDSIPVFHGVSIQFGVARIDPTQRFGPSRYRPGRRWLTLPAGATRARRRPHAHVAHCSHLTPRARPPGVLRH